MENEIKFRVLLAAIVLKFMVFVVSVTPELTINRQYRYPVSWKSDSPWPMTILWALVSDTRYRYQPLFFISYSHTNVNLSPSWKFNFKQFFAFFSSKFMQNISMWKLSKLLPCSSFSFLKLHRRIKKRRRISIPTSVKKLLLDISELIFIVTFASSPAYRKTNIIEISDCDSES